MRPSRLAAVTLLASLVLFAMTATAQQRIPNPEFPVWAKAKKGDRVTRLIGSAKVEYTVIEVGADRVVLGVTASVDGIEIPNQSKKIEVTKTMVKGMEDKTGATMHMAEAAWFWSGKAPAGVKTGEEKVKIGDVEYKTQWYIIKHQEKAEAKIWASDDIPGRFVKLAIIYPAGKTPAEREFVILEAVPNKSSSSK